VGGGVRGKQERSVRRWIIFFIIALALSGLTAFALETELGWLVGGWPFARGGSLYGWVLRVYAALRDINLRYPFLAYGYDWLAFIAGTVRGIPIYWRLIDCSFGVVGLVPLSLCYRRIRLLEESAG
jgi:hypothetical protein